jgi:hypothetical protein
MAESNEDLMDRTLRWMGDNLEGAYNAKYPPGHPKEGDHCVNSGTCILVCCYINALGKVLLKGGPAPNSRRRDFQRFREFLRRCMPDFLSESSKKALPKSGDEWLYEVFRCGFIHNYYPGTDGAWSRRPKLKEYWFQADSREALNVDELVRGFVRGIKEFRQVVEADPDLRSNFQKYLLA